MGPGSTRRGRRAPQSAHRLLGGRANKVDEVKGKIEEALANYVPPCVEINQCAPCTRQFFAKSFLGDDRGRPGSVERRGTGIATPSSRRRVDGVEDDAMNRAEVKF